MCSQQPMRGSLHLHVLLGCLTFCHPLGLDVTAPESISFAADMVDVPE